MTDEFFSYLEYEKNSSLNTVAGYRNDLEEFCGFFENRGIGRAEDLDHKKLREWVAFLVGKRYGKNSISRKLSCVRSFFRFMVKRDLVKENPAAYLSSFKKEERIPSFLEYGEVQALLELPDKSTLKGSRDAAILELLYSSGLRLGELVSLNIGDVDFISGTVKVKGKGSKQRFIPVGEKALECLERYLSLRKKPGCDRQELFLNNGGTRLTGRSVGRLLGGYIEALSIRKKVTPHTLRHTFATHLLNAGCDLRSIQEMLGHVNLSTTQIYTHMTTQKLKKVYSGTHPHAYLKRQVP